MKQSQKDACGDGKLVQVKRLENETCMVGIMRFSEIPANLTRVLWGSWGFMKEFCVTATET